MSVADAGLDDAGDTDGLQADAEDLSVLSMIPTGDRGNVDVHMLR